MTEFEETSKKIQDLVDEVFKQGIGVGYDHGLEVGTQNGYKRGYENGKKSIEECAGKITYKDIHDAYQRGYDDAWESARKIYIADTLDKYSASEGGADKGESE